jgi:8-oxo-dGTP pyrophosphatase MutT (NUDIX family)
MPHIHEKIDFTVNVYIVYGDRVLLRQHDKYKIWLAPGGHIDLDEDPNQAAVREAWEETGLKVKLLDTRDVVIENDTYKELVPPMSLNRHDITNTHEHVSLEYVAIAETDEVVPQDESDASGEWKWYSKEEVMNDESLREGVKKDAIKAIDLVKKYQNKS